MSATRTDVLIAGAGLAGARTAETLRAAGFDGRITLAGAEPHPPYERPALSKAYLLGERPAAELALRPAAFWQDAGIDLHIGAPVARVDIRARRASLGGRELRWRHLVLATGARVRRLPGFEGTNVHHLRTLDDAARLGGTLVAGARLAIIGAGFIGLEVASAARRLGAAVTVVDVAPVPLAAALGEPVGTRMADLACEAGVTLLMGRSVASIDRDRGPVERLVLDDGTVIGCDAVLVGVGACPSGDLVATQLPVARDGAIPVDECGRTVAAGVYACGDVAATTRCAVPLGRVEHWTSAAAGARAVAHTIMGVAPPAAAPTYFWTDQFGSRLQVVGRAEPEAEVEVEEGPGWFVARYHPRGGCSRAVALLNRPDMLATARQEVAGDVVEAVAAVP